jgi:transcriptional regulator with XRE-family HTH domain
LRLGDRLRQARESARLSQIQVKGYTGINNKTLSNYEKNVSSPDPYTLKTLADLYGVTTDWLISGEQLDFQQSTSYISSEDLRLLGILKNLSIEKKHAIEILLSDTEDSTEKK